MGVVGPVLGRVVSPKSTSKLLDVFAALCALLRLVLELTIGTRVLVVDANGESRGKANDRVFAAMICFNFLRSIFLPVTSTRLLPNLFVFPSFIVALSCVLRVRLQLMSVGHFDF